MKRIKYVSRGTKVWKTGDKRVDRWIKDNIKDKKSVFSTFRQSAQTLLYNVSRGT